MLYLRGLSNACLQHQYCPSHYRQGITVILWTLGKDESTQPRSYLSITLLNALGKVLEAVFAARLAYLADTYHILPRLKVKCEQHLQITSVSHAIAFGISEDDSTAHLVADLLGARISRRWRFLTYPKARKISHR